MAIEDRFPGHTGPKSAVVTGGTRCARVTAADGFDDDGELPFRCRYFTADADGELKVRTKDGDQSGQTIQVFKGHNMHRLDQIFVTGSDELVIELWD